LVACEPIADRRTAQAGAAAWAWAWAAAAEAAAEAAAAAQAQQNIYFCKNRANNDII